MVAVRADESIHREFNHYFCELKPNDEVESLEVTVDYEETLIYEKGSEKDFIGDDIGKTALKNEQ